ncbi:MAG: hypothetical protein ACI4U5_06085 [Bacilli bacterium]
MFENIYPHKIPFVPQKDGKLFEEFKSKLRKYNIESINIYLSDSLAHANEEDDDEKILYIMTKNALGIIPDDDIIISTWNTILENNHRKDLISPNLKVIFINSEAMALEKNVRDDKNKVYISKLVEKKTKIKPYKVFAFTTYTAGSSFYDERSAMYLYTSGYNIIFDTREDYDEALAKKESLEQDICLTLNKLTVDTLRRKTTIMPIIRFLYRDLIKDIDEMDKENRKQF